MKQRRRYGTLLVKAVAAGVLFTGAGLAQATFMGRDVSNDPGATCAVSGATKCNSFYNNTLDITIPGQWLSEGDQS